MTICINGVTKDKKSAIDFISKPDCYVEQIVRAWHESKINHCFENKDMFREAVKKNRKTLGSPDIDTLFKLRNYLFSTKAKHRLATLYFKNKTTKQTGRLRQQHHSKGPLARIDTIAKTHLFPISEERQKRLYKLIKKNQLPRICPGERQPEDGKYHIEFARTGKNRRHWSEGKVADCKRNDERTQQERDDLKRRIDSALKNILGI
jgi:archaeosine-15-forming tRNA-guanine transglycosylase